MRFIYKILLLISLSTINNINAQNFIEGKILFSDNSVDIPIEGANIYWENSNIGVITNNLGDFKIKLIDNKEKLVISYVGFVTDTITINNKLYIEHYLTQSDEQSLDQITVTKKRRSAQRTYLMPQNIVKISEEELLKAACCNLSESFETNPAVDVNHNDALTGNKQIKMLGLKSPYILITEENIPMVRGASQTYGLSFIPGPWIESIQITKGMGSITNGYESIVGQINAELKKPLNDIPLFINSYYGIDGRFEINTHLNSKINEKVQTTIFAHHNRRDNKNDKNDDGFLDKPLQNQINFLNKWQYTNPTKGLVSFLNLKYLDDEKTLGTILFSNNPKIDMPLWGGEILTKRFDSSFKLGYVNPSIPYQSIGFQLSYSSHDQDSFYGSRNYDINQKSIFSNIIYNTIITNSRNKIKFGLNYSYDNYDEMLSQKLYTDIIKRKDNSVGAFFEYNYDNFTNFNIVAGLRYDQHNNMGSFFTPRVHFRYSIAPRFSLKGSIGTGRRISNILTENLQIFVTNRVIQNKNLDNLLYGLKPEKATNYGISIDKGFSFIGGQGNFIIDYYKTDFDNKIIVDFEKPREVTFYNSENNQSKSSSFQAELLFSKNRWNITAAYKNYDIKLMYKDGLKQKPLQPREILFFNFGTESRKVDEKLWKYDFTFNFLGKQRLMKNVRDKNKYSSSHFTINSQVTRVFSEKFEIYVGGENLNNYMQPEPIIFASDPFNKDFDASIIHGPIFGATYYAGLRYKILN